jgi:formyl-CoA transferase
MRGVETGPDLPAPALGAQGAAILGEFGLSPERIARLIETGILAQPEPETAPAAAALAAGAARPSGGRP